LLLLNLINEFDDTSISTIIADLDAGLEDQESWNQWWNNEFSLEFNTTGQVLTVADNVVTVRGLSDVMVGEVVYVLSNQLTNNNKFIEIIGQALNLNDDGTTGIVLFGDETLVLAGNLVFGSKTLLSVNVGTSVLGAVVNALGNLELHGNNTSAICLSNGVYDNTQIELKLNNLLLNKQFLAQLAQDNIDWDNGTLNINFWSALLSEYLNYNFVFEVENVPYKKLSSVETKAPGIIQRSGVNRALYTGLKAIDGLIPIGRGQRELIIGDRQTGKTTIAIDTILRQNTGLWLGENTVYDVFSIYVAIGQKRSFVRQLFTRLADYNRVDSTLIVAATASEPAALQFLAPYTGATFGEAFRDYSKDAVIIYDDLSKHAVAYRQMSLLLRRPPGREAYPGDVFYLHSRLLERAAQLKSGGSLTALPVIETQAGDVTAYIPTNVISITDGQIFLEAEMFHKGIRPAIHMGLSVSRVGSAAQIEAMKKVTGSLKLQLAQFRELESFASFGGELDETTLIIINRGLRLVELLKQKPYKPYDVHWILSTLFAGSFGFLDKLAVNKVGTFEVELIKTLEANSALVAFLKRVSPVKAKILNPILKRLLTKIVVDIVNRLNK